MEASGRWLNDFISMLLGKLKIEFTMLLGNKIKSLRDEQGILQRQVAAYFHVDEKELLILWLADRILDAIEGEKELQFRAIEVAKHELTKADI